jgi:hypothetical protein
VRIRGWLVSLAFGLCELREEQHFFEGGLTGAIAFGLQGFELRFVPGDGAGDAAGIKGEELDFTGVVEKGHGLGESLVSFVVGIRAVAGSFGCKVQSEDIFFDGTGAIEAPGVVGNGLGKRGFGVADGLQGGNGIGAEPAPGVTIFMRPGQ